MSGAEELIPRMRQGIDLTKAGLSVEEGFIASRIDGISMTIAPDIGLPSDPSAKPVIRASRTG